MGFNKSYYIFPFDQFIQFFIGFNSPQTVFFLATSHPMITIQKHCCLCQFLLRKFSIISINQIKLAFIIIPSNFIINHPVILVLTFFYACPQNAIQFEQWYLKQTYLNGLVFFCSNSSRFLRRSSSYVDDSVCVAAGRPSSSNTGAVS